MPLRDKCPSTCLAVLLLYPSLVFSLRPKGEIAQRWRSLVLDLEGSSVHFPRVYLVFPEVPQGGTLQRFCCLSCSLGAYLLCFLPMFRTPAFPPSPYSLSLPCSANLSPLCLAVRLHQDIRSFGGNALVLGCAQMDKLHCPFSLLFPSVGRPTSFIFYNMNVSYLLINSSQSVKMLFRSPILKQIKALVY